jgi:hypothetical protein
MQLYSGLYKSILGLKNNFTAVLAPTTTDDSTKGYNAGSSWINTATSHYYVCLSNTATAAVWADITAGAAAGGTVTNVSVVTANGFAGSVSTSTTTPAITLTTSITGLLNGNGTAVSAATAGTDYSLGTSALATGILKSTTGTGALSIAVAGDFPTLNQNTTGTAATFTGNLTGDVTSVAMATTVASVGGSTAANVHAAELLANAATNANTASAIVKRDASGNFSAGTITANLKAGSIIASYVAKTANYTLLTTDYTVECTANSFTITLPTAVGVAGQIYNVKNSGSGTITIATTSSQTIDGKASGVITLAQYDNLTVQSNGANFIII